MGGLRGEKYIIIVDMSATRARTINLWAPRLGKDDPAVALQECVEKEDLSGALQPLFEAMRCAMILHFLEFGPLAGIGVEKDDFAPERRGGAEHDNPWQREMAAARPQMARFSDYVSDHRLSDSGLYQDWLAPRNLKNGAMIAAVRDGHPLAWITFYKERWDGDFSEEEMRFLRGYQRHFDAAINRLARASQSQGLDRLIAQCAEDNGLSARESEVFALLIQGQTNAEIGARLFISASTVKVHVERILAKTGARSRAELAALLLANLSH